MKETKEKKIKKESLIDKSKDFEKKATTKNPAKCQSTDKDINYASTEEKEEKEEKGKKTEKIKSVEKNKIDSKKILNEKKPISKYQGTEYYDLPYRYNQTVIKILAQTPHAIFIYWDISDSDRQDMIEKYGKNFFNETKPVLLINNKTLNSKYEIEIDDFTNSWYLHTPTSNCIFEIELGRKKVTQNESIKFENNSNIMHITKSNTLESPNDHILKETLRTVYFKNIKTNELEKRDVSNYRIENIHNLIELYNDENGFENNPSSEFKI